MNELLSRRIVVKVGTSTLTYENGKLNLKNFENLCKVLSDLQNMGKQVILVSSGAIGVGFGKLNLPERPKETRYKQAVAAVGQCELMFMYDKVFGEYNHTVAQVLLTKNVLFNEHLRQNAYNTFSTLLEMGIIPIVNENDTVAIDELELEVGENDSLAATVAALANADLLIIMSDIDGLYDCDPRKNKDAKRFEVVKLIDDDIRKMASGSGSNRGTGGMITKVSAAAVANEAGINCCVMNGNAPERLLNLIQGESVGTMFLASK